MKTRIILDNMTLNLDDIHDELAALAMGNNEYAHFNKRIVNTGKTVLGVRVPALRKLAKRLARGCTADDIVEYIEHLDAAIYEHVMLAGMMINYATLPDFEKIELATHYLPLADSWAEIDTFAMKRKSFDEQAWWDFAARNLKSKDEFVVRYGVIEMMANYLTDAYIERVFSNLRRVTHDGYYVRMGMAWLYASAAVKYYDETLKEINTANLPTWTKKKALTKMLESYQFTAEQKDEIRALRSEV